MGIKKKEIFSRLEKWENEVNSEYNSKISHLDSAFNELAFLCEPCQCGGHKDDVCICGKCHGLGYVSGEDDVTYILELIKERKDILSDKRESTIDLILGYRNILKLLDDEFELDEEAYTLLRSMAKF